MRRRRKNAKLQVESRCRQLVISEGGRGARSSWTNPAILRSMETRSFENGGMKIRRSEWSVDAHWRLGRDPSRPPRRFCEPVGFHAHSHPSLGQVRSTDGYRRLLKATV